MGKNKIIGIVGGTGPYAGLDLVKKIFDFTEALCDQEHLRVKLISVPDRIKDRTAFLLGECEENPAVAIVDIIRELESCNAEVVGIPCNTSHSSAIFDEITSGLKKNNSQVKLINMVSETVKSLKAAPGIEKVGVLSTNGTREFKIYSDSLAENNFKVLLPDDQLQNEVHQAIYDRNYGIKAHSNPTTQKAREVILKAIGELKKQGANAVIMGCTELPLAVPEPNYEEIPLIDTTAVLARAIIREAAPEKLKTL
jgi:aspartate racemase